MPVELIIGAAVGAAVASKTGRHIVRRGLVYGLAGALTAYDRVAAVTHGVVRGVRHGVSNLADEAAATAHAEAAPSANAAANPANTTPPA